MIHAIITGELCGPVERKTSKSGKPFATTKVRFKDGEKTVWVSVAAFGENVICELGSLFEGEYLSIQGKLNVDVYNNKPTLGLLANHVMVLRQEKSREAFLQEAKC